MKELSKSPITGEFGYVGISEHFAHHFASVMSGTPVDEWELVMVELDNDGEEWAVLESTEGTRFTFYHDGGDLRCSFDDGPSLELHASEIPGGYEGLYWGSVQVAS